MPINGSTLRELARFVDVDLDAALQLPETTRRRSAPSTRPSTSNLRSWPRSPTGSAWPGASSTTCWRRCPSESEVATIQLWPEHFDAATTVTLPSAQPVNLGFSPGDGFESEPYLYVGPWGPARPGDPRFWNAPFGAVRRRAEVLGAPTPPRSVAEFLTDGLRLATRLRTARRGRASRTEGEVRARRAPMSGDRARRKTPTVTRTRPRPRADGASPRESTCSPKNPRPMATATRGCATVSVGSDRRRAPA